MYRVCWSGLWTLAIALVPALATAQTVGTVTGRAIDESTGSPLSAVRISIVSTGQDARTNEEGRYVLVNVAAGPQQVRANRIGYAQRVSAVIVSDGGSVAVDFALDKSAVRLDEVIVSAITGQAERKRELGTNTASIQVADLPKGPITKVADVLTGRTAGVNLQGVAGTTGTSQRIRIRGANSLSLSNEPLIFVDGVRFDNTSAQQASGNPRAGIAVGGQDFSRLNDLNPEDIENIEILKGPAASALYGTAAANGVLLITTKRGVSGAPKWRAYAEYGSIKDVTDYPDIIFTYQRNTPGPVFRPDGQINDASFDGVVTSCSNRIRAGGTCRQDETVRFNPAKDSRTTPFQTGNRRKIGLSVSGGSEAVTYFLSGDKEDEQGVISYNDLDKTALRANFTAALNPKAELRLTSSYTSSDLTIPGGDNNIFSPLIGPLLGSPGFVADADGKPASGQYGFGLTNRELSEYIVGQENDRFVLGLNGSYRPLAWLNANANVGLDYYTQASKQTVQPGEIPIGSPYDEGFRDSRAGQSYLYTGNASATATFGVTPTILSTTTAGGNYQRDYSTLVTCFGAGIVTGSASCSASTSLFAVTENFYEVITLGGYLQQGVAFNDRLFLSASIRGDDNSAFGTDFGFVFYPAASISWVVSEESFFPRVPTLGNLRLRTSIGTSGLRPDFRQAQFLNAVVSVQDANSELAAVTVRSTGNETLKPERTTEYEVGLDADLFDARLSLDFTYFRKSSRDALIARDLAPSFGLTGDDANSGSIFQNLGEIRNSGTELGLNIKAFDTDRARLDLRLSATTIDNEIVDLGAGVEPIVFNRNTQQHIAGFPAGGYFQLPYTYDDANGDGKLALSEVTIDDSRFTVIRLKNRDGSTRVDTIPEVFYGQSLATNSQSLSGALTLFRFVTVSTLFDRRAGFKQLNDTESFRCGVADSRRNSTGQGGCIATGDPNASLDEQARFLADRFLGTTAGYIEDGDFIKWRELAIAVGIPPRLSRGFRALDGATLTFAGRNLKTWTDYSGFDPESNETGGDTNYTQGEFNTQPPVRYFTLRLDLNF